MANPFLGQLNRAFCAGQERRSPALILPLDLQKLLLAPQPAAISRQRPIRPDDAMTGNKNRNLIGAIGLRDGTYGSGPAKLLRNLRIASDLPCPHTIAAELYLL